MKLPLLLLFVCSSITLYAQDDKIDADRPDQTDGTHVIKPGEVQSENDFYYNSFEGDKPALVISSLLRIGVFKFSELRITAQEGQQRDRFVEETGQGIYPLAVGTKIALLKDHKWLPDISFIGTLQIPLTSKTSDKQMRWAPTYNFAFEKEWGKFCLGVNAGIKAGAFENNYSEQATASLRYEVSEKVTVFTEYFGQYSSDENPQHNIDGGLLYFPIDNLQLSFSMGSTLFYDDYNRFVLVGAAIRLPK